MATVIQVFRQSFTTSDSITVAHGAGNLAVAVRVLIDDDEKNELISSVVPDSADPRNKLIVKLMSPQTGIIQVVTTGLASVVAPNGAATKVAFFAGADYNVNVGNFRARSQGSSGAFRYTFPIPDDFTALIDVALIGIPNGVVTAGTVSLSGSHGAPGEPHNTHAEADVIDPTLIFTGANNIAEMDVSSVFSNLSAGDWCGLLVDHNGVGTTINYIQVRLRYT